MIKNLRAVLPGILGWNDVIYKMIIDNLNEEMSDEECKQNIRKFLSMQEQSKEPKVFNV